MPVAGIDSIQAPLGQQASPLLIESSLNIMDSSKGLAINYVEGRGATKWENRTPSRQSKTFYIPPPFLKGGNLLGWLRPFLPPPPPRFAGVKLHLPLPRFVAPPSHFVAPPPSP